MIDLHPLFIRPNGVSQVTFINFIYKIKLKSSIEKIWSEDHERGASTAIQPLNTS